MFEIIDNDGTIHSGSEEEMRLAFDVMTKSVVELMRLGHKRLEIIKKITQYSVEWNGDLKLVEVKAVFK